MALRIGVLAILAISFLGSVHSRTSPLDGAADACQACLVSVRVLEDVLCDPAATDFLVDLVEKQICPVMGDKAQCYNLAEGLVPTLIQWFRASATPASLCSSAGVCGSAVQQVPALNKPSLRVRNTPECGMCVFVVRKMENALNDAHALEKIKEAALKACSALPGELSDSCSDFVNKYEPMIAQLVSSLDPEMVCGLVGACLADLTTVAPPPLPVALVKALAGTQALRRPPPPAMCGILAALGLPPPMMGPGGGMMGFVAGGMMGPGNDVACEYCKMAVIEAHSLISNPSVQAEVLNYTLAVCDSFPSLAAPCKAYVTMYAPLVCSLLEEYLVPETVCAQTGMCPPPPAGTATWWSDSSAPHHPPGPSCGFFGWLRQLVVRLGWLSPRPEQELFMGKDGAQHEKYVLPLAHAA